MHVTPPPNPRCNSCSTITRASEVPNRGRPRPAPVSGIVAITLVVMTLTSAGCAAADALSQVRLVVGEDLNIHTMNGTTETVAELPSRVFAGFSEVDNAGTSQSVSRRRTHLCSLDRGCSHRVLHLANPLGHWCSSQIMGGGRGSALILGASISRSPLNLMMPR